MEKDISVVLEISREYVVFTAVFWKSLDKYSCKRGVEILMSDTRKILDLKVRICEIDQMVGQK